MWTIILEESLQLRAFDDSMERQRMINCVLLGLEESSDSDRERDILLVVYLEESLDTSLGLHLQRGLVGLMMRLLGREGDGRWDVCLRV